MSMIYYAPEKWDGLWRNRQQLMSRFARQNKVLFVEPRLHLRPTMTGLRRGSLGWSDLRRPTIRPISDNLYVFRYPVLAPVSGQLPLKQMARTIRRLALRRALRQLNMTQPIVWFSRPDMLDLLDEAPSPCLRVYHVVDEYTAYSNHTPESQRRLEANEKQMLAQVDAVIVVSKNLYEAKRPFNQNTYLVANGVNYQAYTAALDAAGLPEALQAIRPPRLGYIGLIGDKLNLAMLKEVAEQNPDWSVVLVGQTQVSHQAEAWQALQGLPNVHHLGAVPASEVPNYVKGFQVGLMPYLQNRHADHISPLKLYDYLAAGIPIASLDFPAAREFAPYVHLAANPQDFGRTVRAALVDTTPERRQARRAVAAQHTWEARVEQISTLLQPHLATETLVKERKQRGLQATGF
jgi:glycosyltransferase involved in cell wall biosynthesis